MTRRSLAVTVVLVSAIIIPFALWESDLLALSQQWLTDADNQTVLAGIIVALLALDVFLPTPSSLVSIAAGIQFHAEIATILIFIGMSLGCVMGYFLGRLVPVNWAFPDPDEIARVQNLYRRYGALSLMLARAVPVVAEASVIHAGIARVPFIVVLAYTLPANLAIGALYAGAGRWLLANPVIGAGIGFLLLMVFGAWRFAIPRRQRQAGE